MQFNNYLKRKMPILALLGLLFGLASCGSYQYVGVDSDGIYGGTPVTQNTEAVVEVPNESNSNYYKDYFKTKSIESESYNAEEAIFTDIDTYESSSYVENDTIPNNYQGYEGWGQDSNNITINYIDNGWNNWGWNGGFGWGLNGWNNWGWNNWGWNGGFGGGFYSGWNNPFWGSPFYGGGFYGG